MPSLSDMQAGFAGALLRPGGPVPDGLASPHRLAPRRRFGVYRNNVHASLTVVLRDRFPAVQRLVGAEFFAAMAREFIAMHPPRSTVLMRYGGNFAGFIDGFAPVAGLPYLGDVARLEWARAVALHAADARPLEIEALRRIPPEHVERLIFTLHPSLRILRSEWPVISIWDANQLEGAAQADLGAGGEDALVLRPGLEVVVHRLPDGGAAFIAALAGGQSLGAAAAEGVAAAPVFALQGNLTALLRCGAVIETAL
jgi:hypothetical protein